MFNILPQYTPDIIECVDYIKNIGVLFLAMELSHISFVYFRNMTDVLYILLFHETFVLL